MRSFFLLSPSVLSVCFVFCPIVSSPVLAQITPDGTLGSESTIVSPNQTIDNLPADLIQGGATRGSNLFHSFLEFNVNAGQRVYFGNPTGIDRILSRVTGSDISDILGTLGVNGGADLFLINPNGIIFGPNAQLDISGSFVGSSAESIVFSEFEFSATNPTAPPLLTVNFSPTGLRFGANAGDIRLQPGESPQLVLVTEDSDAGQLLETAQGVNPEPATVPNQIQGELSTNNDVDLYQVFLPAGSTIAPSTVGGSTVDTRLFLFDQLGLGLVANDDSQGTFQSALPEITQSGVYYLGISSWENSALSAEGPIFTFFPDGSGPGANAPLISWDNSGFDSGSYTISLASPAPRTGNLAVPPGQSLALIGGNVRLEEGKILSPGSNVYIGGVSGAGVVPLESGLHPILPAQLPRADIGLFDTEINVRGGGGGAIVLEGDNIDILGGSTRVRAGIESGQGFSGAQAGDVKINGTGGITIDGAAVSNTVIDNGTGKSGNIFINSDSLSLLNSGRIVNESFGLPNSDLGNIVITVSQIEISGAFGGIFNRVRPGVIANSGNVS